MSNTITKDEAVQMLEDMHQEVFNLFHEFRKEHSNTMQTILNGAQMNKIIVLAKKRVKRERNLHNAKLPK